MRILLLIFCLPCLLIGKEKVIYQETQTDLIPPWLTGPLLAPSAHVVPLGYVNIEPYIYATAIGGSYNTDWKVDKSPTFWYNSCQIPIQVGIASWLDFEIIPTVIWNYTQHIGHWALGDLVIGFDVQLYEASPSGWIPYVKMVLQETIPTGKYKNLDPADQFTTVGGLGSWNTGIGLVFGKLIHITSVYFFNWRLYLQYTLPAPVHVTGYSIYLGSYNTDARFFPRETFQADFGMELTLSQNWALALDVLGIWGGRTHFSGFPGTNPDGSRARLGKGSQVQYSVAPAIEYNWNENLGVIGGVWLTLAGRNAQAFTSGVLALNYYF